MKNEIQGMRSIFGICGNPFAEPNKEPRQTKTKPQKRYIKPPELREFENEYNAHKYDNSVMPEYARIRTHFRDDTANGLTTAVIAHLQYYGHFAARVNVGGVYNPKRGKYRHSQSRKGMADVSAVVNGRPLQIEVKAGKDKPRPDQLQVAAEYEQAGGLYVFIHNFADYMQVYNKICVQDTQ